MGSAVCQAFPRFLIFPLQFEALASSHELAGPLILQQSPKPQVPARAPGHTSSRRNWLWLQDVNFKNSAFSSSQTNRHREREREAGRKASPHVHLSFGYTTLRSHTTAIANQQRSCKHHGFQSRCHEVMKSCRPSPQSFRIECSSPLAMLCPIRSPFVEASNNSGRRTLGPYVGLGPLPNASALTAEECGPLKLSRNPCEAGLFLFFEGGADLERGEIVYKAKANAFETSRPLAASPWSNKAFAT